MRASARLPAPSLDYTTILGFGAAVGVVVAAVALDGRLALFFDPAALLLVVFGTLAITVAGSDAQALREGLRVWGRDLWRRPRRADPALARELLRIARRAKGEGVLQLESECLGWDHLPLVRRGLLLVLEGRNLADVEAILRQDLAGQLDRRRRAEAMFRRAAEVAPAMGLVGTLVGLVKMLAQLDDPASIGPAMAVALLTTLYGALMAHVLFGPAAEKLALYAREEVLRGQMEAATVLAVARGEHPRYLAGRLESLLHPELRAGLETEN